MPEREDSSYEETIAAYRRHRRLRGVALLGANASLIAGVWLAAELLPSNCLAGVNALLIGIVSCGIFDDYGEEHREIAEHYGAALPRQPDFPGPSEDLG